MNLKNKVNIHNRFDIEVRDAKTGLIKKTFTSYNIVLNQMYTRLCGGLSYFVNIHFGSSTGTLSATRTSLFSHLGTKAAVDEEIVKAIPLSIWKRKIVLNPEEFVGSTISEVGIAFGATNTNLVTHSLLKDSEGNPISIVKTDVDVITIYATVFVTFDNSNPNLVYIGMPTSNSLVNYLIGGSTAPTGAFSLNDVFLVNAKLGTTSNASWTADTSNKQRKTNVLRFGTTVGNGQVKFLEFANVFSLEFPYNSVFNGQSYEGVSLGVGDGVKDTFDLPSANIKGEGLALKVNGLNNNQLVKEISLGRFRGIRDFETTFVDGTYHTSISGDGSKVITAGSASPYCFVFEKIGYSFVQVLSPLVTVPVTGCCISDDGLLIALSHSVTPFLSLFEWDGLSWNPKSVPTIVGSATCVSISTDKSVIAIGGASIRSYDYINSVLTPRPIPSQNITDEIGRAHV